MKQKIFVLIVTLLMTLCSVIVPRNIEVAASGECGDPEIDHQYIYNRTKKLSHIVFENFSYWNKSRFFGTDGERHAANRIKNWMTEIGLSNVHLEEIDKFWGLKYEKVGDSLYMGWLNEARVMKDFYINITIYDKSDDWSVKEYKNLSWTKCFPGFLREWPWKNSKTAKENNVPIVEDFKSGEGPQIELGYTHYSETYKVYDSIYEQNLPLQALLPGFKGVIGIDNDTDAFVEFPPQFDQKLLEIPFENQSFSVNKTIGAWIEEAIKDPDLYPNASYYAHWEKEDVTSYNVIGQINKTGQISNTSNVSIVCAHYDCMWNQGTIDEAAETALVLGIAKYIKDYELESALKHNVKFIAFGAEEVGIRGAKDYILEHIKNETKSETERENVIYIVNPGNFGHYNRTGLDYYNNPLKMDLELGSDKPWLNDFTKNITDALDYTQRTNQTGPGYIDVIKYRLRAEDSQIFGNTKSANASIQFGRGPNKGHHRDGLDHTVGDVLGNLDNGTFELECEVVASVALHLLLNYFHQFENCSFVPIDLEGDGNNDSIKITVNMSTNVNATLPGKAIAQLYNESGGHYIWDDETSFLPLNKNNITNTNLTLTLLPNKPAGNYKANLTLWDAPGNLQEDCNQTFYLYPYQRPVAMFSIAQSGSKTFSFQDESVPSPGASINSWNWSFGDGNFSDNQNPGHTYANKGIYDVTLIITDDNSYNDSITHQVIASNDFPSASFSTSQTVECKGESFTFTSTSLDTDGDIMNIKWNFGDGTVEYGTIKSHSYTQSGVYTVTMSVTDNDGDMNETTDTVFAAGALVDDSYPGDDPPNHKWTTIQEGINDIKDNELLYVYNGSYNSGITVNRSISLYGEDASNVVINGTGTALSIVNDSALIDSFTIENATIGIHLNGASIGNINNCFILNSGTGIKIENNAEMNIITHCNFTNNSYGVFITGSDSNIVGSISSMEQPVWNDSVFMLNDYGVYLENADNNFVTGCFIDGTDIGDLGETSIWGICLDNSDNNKILFCDVYNASNYGMYLSGSSDNTVMHCIVRENDKGVYLSGSSYNSIIGNNFSENSMQGVNILTVSSTGNSVFWNDFIRNGGGRFPQAEDFGSGTDWNTSDNHTFIYNASGEGNHWDDYTGNDADGDGIGDTEYFIPGTANSKDYYPVMESYGWLDEWF